ncbi:uncharacterized protein LOC133180441 [Saccostrea echinata]|uniref:uncharacterized protein LOC133180441 n=1 Tax=Saccostrea echinata TaxID=191078 RepID=UPI002A809DF9|nr:uncharacterized protein LOC133180441 [Saccostrea echinata]
MAASKPKHPLGSPQEHIEMCKTHDLPIDVICEDCDEFICGKCAKTDHRDHEWSTIPTAASQKRRGLLNFLKKIKEEDLPGIEEKIEKMSKQITENEELCDSEIKKLQKHYDEIITSLSEIKKRNERRLRDHLKDKNDQLESVKSELFKKRESIAETVQFMEDSKSAMSDYSMIDNHRELTQLLAGLDVDIKGFKHSVRYSKGEISDNVMEKLIGKTLNLKDICLTETSSFKYGDQRIVFLRALSEAQCYIRELESPYTEQVNKEGEKKHKYNITPNDMCVTDNGDVYFTDFTNYSIRSLSLSGSVSTVISTNPLVPAGICQSVDGGLLVTLLNSVSDRYKLESHSRRLVRHITVTGDVIHEYEYQEDGKTRLFTVPYRITQNSNSEICVVNRTSDTTGDLVIMSPSGRVKSVYRGQNLTGNLDLTNVECDSHCNILVTDKASKNIHLLNPDGEFLKFLLTENEVNSPFRLSLYKSTLWVGYYGGLVKVFLYRV